MEAAWVGPRALVDEDIGAAFVVKDGGGQKLAYVYYEEEPGRRASAKLLTKDEAPSAALTGVISG